MAETVAVGKRVLEMIASMAVSESPMASYTSFSSGLSESARGELGVSFGVSGKRTCMSSMMSPALITSFAPCWMSLFEPADVGRSIGPGTANTLRPCSAACPAVISAPLPRPASTTSTPKLQPLTMRLRIGKVCVSAFTSIENSLTTAPPDSTIFSASAMFSFG